MQNNEQSLLSSINASPAVSYKNLAEKDRKDSSPFSLEHQKKLETLKKKYGDGPKDITSIKVDNLYHKTIMEIKEHQEILIQNKLVGNYEDPFNLNPSYRKMRSPVMNRLSRESMDKEGYGSNYKKDQYGKL